MDFTYVPPPKCLKPTVGGPCDRSGRHFGSCVPAMGHEENEEAVEGCHCDRCEELTGYSYEAHMEAYERDWWEHGGGRS